MSASESYKYDVFLSWSSLDNEATGNGAGVASSVASRLRAAGLVVFFTTYRPPAPTTPQQERLFRQLGLVGSDEDDVGSGRVAGWLADELEGSCHCVALTSATYALSPWCQLELAGFRNLHRQDVERILIELPIGERLDNLVSDWWDARVRGSDLPDRPDGVWLWRSSEVRDAADVLLRSPLRAGRLRKTSVQAFAPLPILELYERSSRIDSPDRERPPGGLAGAARANPPLRYRCPGCGSPFPFAVTGDEAGSLRHRHPDYVRYEMVVRGLMVERLITSRSGPLRQLADQQSRTRAQRVVEAWREWIDDLKDVSRHVKAAFAAVPLNEPSETVAPWLYQARRDAHDLIDDDVSPFAAAGDET